MFRHVWQCVMVWQMDPATSQAHVRGLVDVWMLYKTILNQSTSDYLTQGRTRRNHSTRPCQLFLTHQRHLSQRSSRGRHGRCWCREKSAWTTSCVFLKPVVSEWKVLEESNMADMVLSKIATNVFDVNINANYNFICMNVHVWFA